MVGLAQGQSHDHPTLSKLKVSAMTKERRTYRINGLVQGVGFRPTLWHVAHTLGLFGEVWNDADGVGTILEGNANILNRFELELRPVARELRIRSSPRMRLHARPVPSRCSHPATVVGAMLSPTVRTVVRALRSRAPFPMTGR